MKDVVEVGPFDQLLIHDELSDGTTAPVSVGVALGITISKDGIQISSHPPTPPPPPSPSSSSSSSPSAGVAAATGPPTPPAKVGVSAQVDDYWNISCEHATPTALPSAAAAAAAVWGAGPGVDAVPPPVPPRPGHGLVVGWHALDKELADFQQLLQSMTTPPPSPLLPPPPPSPPPPPPPGASYRSDQVRLTAEKKSGRLRRLRRIRPSARLRPSLPTCPSASVHVPIGFYRVFFLAFTGFLPGFPSALLGPRPQSQRPAQLDRVSPKFTPSRLRSCGFPLVDDFFSSAWVFTEFLLPFRPSRPGSRWAHKNLCFDA